MATARPLTFAQLLKHHRRVSGLTQQELADQASISVRAVTSLERGINRTPHQDTVVRLIAALGLAGTERAQFAAAARGRAAPSFSAAHAPVRIPELVGRDAELVALKRHLAGATPPLLLLAGEPGIGKTRLLSEAAGRARDLGWVVLEGGCHRRGGQEPYAPLLGALLHHIRGLPPAELRAALRGCAWLVRLLPELADDALVPSPRWAVAPGQERRLMFAAVGGFLEHVAGPAGTLLVLDDLQWAEADALDLLAGLLRGLPARPLRAVAAYRDTEVADPDPLPQLLADLTREGLAARLSVGPLVPAAAARLLADLVAEAGAGALAPALQAEVLRRAEGVPYFLISCVQALQLEPPPSRGDVSGQVSPALATLPAGVPWDVAQTIRQRVARLSPAARDLLAVAAVAGRTVSGALLYAAGRNKGTAESDMFDALADVGQARLLIEEADDRYRFAHDLIREVVLADLGGARRRALHRCVAEALERRPEDAPAATLAKHYLRAGLPGRALPWLRGAGDQAWVRRAFAEAAGYYRELVDRLVPLGRAREGDAARERLAEALMRTARYGEARALAQHLADVYAAAGDLEGMARVAALLGWIHALDGTLDEGLAWIAPLLPAVEAGAEAGMVPPGVLAELHLSRAELLVHQRRYTEYLAAAERAALAARAAGDGVLMRRAALRLATALRARARGDEAYRVLVRLAAEAEATGDDVCLCYALNQTGMLHNGRGDLAAERRCVDRAVALAPALGNRDFTAFLAFRRAMNAFYAGRWDEAELDLEWAAGAMGPGDRETRGSTYGIYVDFGRARFQLARGDPRGAAAALDQLSARASQGGIVQPVRWAQSCLAERDLLEGRPWEARDRLEPLIVPPEEDDSVVPAVARLAWAHVEMGDDTHAEVLLDQITSGPVARENRLEQGDALRVRAQIAAGRSRWVEGVDVLELALGLARSCGDPYGEARVEYTYGLVHERHGDSGAARTHLEAAQSILGRLGERLYAEHVERALAQVEPE